jgi:hypothetical protein
MMTATYTLLESSPAQIVKRNIRVSRAAQYLKQQSIGLG